MDDVYERTGSQCTVDSAFSLQNHACMIKLGRDPLDITEYGNPEEVLESIEVPKAATLMRQTAEWGMRGFQSSFPCVRDRLIYEERGDRKRILKFLIYFTIYVQTK